MNSNYLVDPDGVERNGCLSTGLAIFAVVVAMVIAGCCLSSCSTTKCIPERVEVHDTVVHTDTTYIYRFHDSIVYRDRQDSTYLYEKDSTSEKQRGDTIYVTKWKVKYQYVYKASTDNTNVKTENTDISKTEDKEKKAEKEVIVKTERYIPGFYKFTMWLFWIVVVVLVVWFVWWLADYIPVLKPYKQAIKGFLKIGKLF